MTQTHRLGTAAFVAALLGATAIAGCSDRTVVRRETTRTVPVEETVTRRTTVESVPVEPSVQTETTTRSSERRTTIETED